MNMNNPNVMQIEIQNQMNRESRYSTNHVLHLILSIITVGLWVPLWLLVAISNANERQKARIKVKKLLIELSKEEN